MMKSLDLLVLHRVAVLGRDHDRVDALDLRAVVLERHLRLAVGTQPADLARLADLGQPLAQRVRVKNRRRHQVGRLVAGKTEHQPLVARALLGGRLALGGFVVHALRDVGALRRQRVHDVDALRVERFALLRVADLPNRVAHHLVVIEIGLRRDLTRDDDEVRFHHRLARHAAVLVLRQAGVQHRIGNRIGDFVRMTLGHRLGGENIGFGHEAELYGFPASQRKKNMNISGCVDISFILFGSCRVLERDALMRVWPSQVPSTAFAIGRNILLRCWPSRLLVSMLSKRRRNRSTRESTLEFRSKPTCSLDNQSGSTSMSAG